MRNGSMRYRRGYGDSMDHFSFKSVAFGGFDKQDVIQYIQQSSEKAAEEQRELQEENDSLREANARLEEQLAALRQEAEKAAAERDRLQKALDGERSARETLEPLRPLEEEAARLRAENAALKPDAKAYAQFRERLGSIECEARKRADDLEAAAYERMQKTVELFQTQYQALMSTFESTAGHVTGELRKIEVNLSQLPRVMDQAEAELKELSSGFGPQAGQGSGEEPRK